MDKHGTINKTTIFVAILTFIGIMILLLLPAREPTEQEKVKQWKPRDFYYIYQMWTNRDLAELRREIYENQQRTQARL